MEEIDLTPLGSKQNRQEFIDIIETDRGRIVVHRVGDSSLPTLITYHDVGLNHKNCFLEAFQNSEIGKMFSKFQILHINAPGQEEEAPEWSSSVPFPSFDEMVEQITIIRKHFGVEKFVGFGVGLGASLLCAYAVKHPEIVKGLILVGPTSKKVGWFDWMYSSTSLWTLSTFGITNAFKRRMLNIYFSPETFEKDSEKIALYSHHFDNIHSKNLHLLLSSFSKRPDFTKALKRIQCMILIFVGENSYWESDVDDMHPFFPPINTHIVKVPHCGQLITVENPKAMQNSIEWFLKAISYL